MQNISVDAPGRKINELKDKTSGQNKHQETPTSCNRRLPLLLDTMPVGLLVQQKPGRIAFTNQRLAEILGYQPDQLADRPLNEIVYLDDQNDVSHRSKIAIAGQSVPAQFTFRAVTKGNRLKSLRAQAIQASWHDRTALIWYIFDIIQEKFSEAVLADKKRTISDQARHIQDLKAALKVLIDHRESEKNDHYQNILISLKKIAFPYIDKIKTGKIDNTSRTYLSMLESNLKDLISSIQNSTVNQLQDLTFTETQVADLIRQGKSSKEIAQILKVSTATISFHRNNLRKKLGLLKKKTTLRTHLQSRE